MRIGLIDLDSHNYPNLPLMKISAYHKQRGDHVEWYDPMFSGHMDKVYMSKVFSFSPDYEYFIDADEIITGGSGYCIKTIGGKESYDKAQDKPLPHEIEHIYPDYSLYGINDTAYGFLSRGCPRGCDFCHVATKEGRRAYKVADLNEFWSGQKNIVICDPNILACREWGELLQQLIDSNAYIDINQGLDIRLMTKEKAEMIKQMKIKQLHFAWDRYADKDGIIPKFQMFKEITGIDYRKLSVFVLCGFDTTFEQDLERVYWLRDNGFGPYVMLYNKHSLSRKSKLRKLQSWVNNRIIFSRCERFEDYDPKKRRGA